MSIKSVKIEMIKADGNVVDAEKQGKVEYQPIATITYNEEEKTTKHVFLDNKLVDKDYFKCWDVGSSFFIGTTDDSYIVYDEDGNRTASLEIEYTGKIIQVDADSFACLLEDWIKLYDINGFAFAGRLLAKDEIEALNS
jgi:hypothetical protein